MPIRDSVELRYTKEEPVPMPVDCSIHASMRGYVVLRANPYMAKSDGNGRFAIKHLPAGDHAFQVWHERIGWLRSIRIGPNKTDARGKLSVTIRAGENTLRDVVLAEKVFARSN